MAIDFDVWKIDDFAVKTMRLCLTKFLDDAAGYARGTWLGQDLRASALEYLESLKNQYLHHQCLAVFVSLILFLDGYRCLFSRKRPRRVLLKKALPLKTVMQDCHLTSPKVKTVSKDCHQRLPKFCCQNSAEVMAVFKDSSAEVMAVFKDCHQRLPKFC